MRLPSRRTVVALGVALAALVSVTLIAVAVADDDDVPAAGRLPARPVVIGTVDIASVQAPGDTVRAQVALRADRPMVLRNAFVEVRNIERPDDARDPAQRALDLQGPPRLEIGDSEARTEMTGTIFAAGTYRYNLVYEWKGRTYSLPPYGTFVVR